MPTSLSSSRGESASAVPYSVSGVTTNPTPTPIKITTELYCICALEDLDDDDDVAMDDSDSEESTQARTDLDSHANMSVVGRNALIMSDTGNIVDVSPYTPDYEPLQVPVVDAAVKHDCP